jgi:short-chain Z-isoprenyl diphosphate synthase
MAIVEKFIERMIKGGVWEVRISGRMSEIPPSSAERFRKLCEATMNQGRKQRLYLAIGYDGQAEIIDAANAVLSRSAANGESCDSEELITAESIENELYASHECYPELVIRTGSEVRMSAFMPWQTTQSEIFFSKLNWPELTYLEFNFALWAYRKRRLSWWLLRRINEKINR